MIGDIYDLAETTIIYTDGSCLKNPGGVGGWAYCASGDSLQQPDNNCFYNDAGAVRSTTNNRMELFAILNGLAAGFDKGYRKLIIRTDSKYCINAFSRYENWCNTNGLGNRKNIDLISMIDFYLVPDVLIDFQWVKGHFEDDWNKWVDKIAYTTAKEKPPKVDIGYESLQQQET